MSKNLTTSILKKAIITISLLSVLAVGTIASSYAASSLKVQNNFTISQYDSKSFTTNSSSAGTLVDVASSYPTIYNGYSYAEGEAYVLNIPSQEESPRRNYYMQKNNPASVTINYGSVKSGNSIHFFQNIAGGGFKVASLETLLYRN